MNSIVTAGKFTNCSKLRSYKNSRFSNKCIIFQNCNSLPYLNLEFNAEIVFMDNCHEMFVNNWLRSDIFPDIQKIYLSSPFNMNVLDMFHNGNNNVQFYLSNKYVKRSELKKDSTVLVKQEQIKNLISKYAPESLVVRTKEDL
jgi:hypothetical protein